MLHLIFQSPLTMAVLQRIAPDDDVLFLDNAVLALLHQGVFSQTVSDLQQNARLFVLLDDITVRGIAADTLVSGISVINDAEFVALTVKNPVIQSWS